MPLHDFRCKAGHVTEAWVEQGVDRIPCEQCRICTPECAAKHLPGYEVVHVGFVAEKVFLRAPMGYVQPDICYDSPVDGRPVTSKQARIEDLRRNGCIEYEPGMRQDFEKNRRLQDQQLDASVEQTVDEFFATAGTRKVEKLEQELRAGASVELERSTPDMTKGVAQ